MVKDILIIVGGLLVYSGPIVFLLAALQNTGEMTLAFVGCVVLIAVGVAIMKIGIKPPRIG